VTRADVVARKVARAEGWLAAAERLLDLDGDPPAVAERDLASFYLQLAIQECIDLAAHWVADDGLTVPETAAGTFGVLADARLLTDDHAALLAASAGLRNRIAHGYAALDAQRIRAEAPRGLTALRRFLVAVSERAGS